MASSRGWSITLVALHLLSAAFAAVVVGIAAAIVARAKHPTPAREAAVAPSFNYSCASYVLFVACSGLLLNAVLALCHMCVMERGLATLFLVERAVAVLWFMFWLTAGAVVSSTVLAYMSWWTAGYPWLNTYAAMVAFAWLSWLVWLAILIVAASWTAPSYLTTGTSAAAQPYSQPRAAKAAPLPAKHAAPEAPARDVEMAADRT